MQIETERLLMRQWTREDIEAHGQQFADEEMARFIGGACDPDTAWRRLATLIGHWTLCGFGYWAVEVKSTGELAGAVGLWRSAGWPELELGYWLLRTAQGKGYATEAARAARDYAFDVLKSETLVSYIDPANTASKLVAERLGASYESTIELLKHGPHEVYRYPKPS